MRLGSRKTIFQPDSEWAKIRSLYGNVHEIEERHRHRYEINPAYIERLDKAGMHFVGKDETGQRMEIFELKDHPYFVGTCCMIIKRCSCVLLTTERYTISCRVPIEGAQPKRKSTHSPILLMRR